MDLTPIPGFSEPFSSLSHLLGAALFAVLSVLMVRRGRGNAVRVASLVVFSFGVVFLLSISGVYHLLARETTARAVMRRLDHAAIFVLIASTFTPIHVIMFRGWSRWGAVAAIWLFAAAAITIKVVYFTQLPDWVGLALYLGMGWFGLGTGIALWRRYGFRFVQYVLYGGVAYSVGAVLEALHQPVIIPRVVEWHEVFHIAVLMGLAFHWSFVFTIADGRLTPPPTCDAESSTE